MGGKKKKKWGKEEKKWGVKEKERGKAEAKKRGKKAFSTQKVPLPRRSRSAEGRTPPAPTPIKQRRFIAPPRCSQSDPRLRPIWGWILF